MSASTIDGVPFRQIAVVLLVLIAIVGAGLFILSWEGDGDSSADADPTDTTTTSTTTTTTIAPVTTSIPVDCGTTTEPDPALDATSTTTIPTTSTTTTIAGADPIDTEPTAPLFSTLNRRSSISTVGLDEVTFGLTVNQATTASGTTFDPCGPVSECYRVTPADAPSGISFVVHAGTIERVDIVGDSPITTVSGAGIGTTDEELDELFGERLERVDLGGGATDAVFVPTSENDAEFRVVFTTVDGVVETMRSGRLPLVLEADPCA